MSRDIGKMGESHFENLCNQVDITVNRSNVDRYGWDYLLEFPEDSNNKLPIDMQDMPIECKIQVKSSDKNSSKCQIKLSAMHKLVKNTSPTFIYFVNYNNEYEPLNTYLLHVDKSIIEQVLKSVRKNEIKNKQLNKVKITIKYKESDKLNNMTSLCLKETIEKYIPNNMNEYIKQKTNILKSVGYDERPFTLKTTFKNVTHNDLIDMSLGLKEALPVEVSQMTQKRFNIDMPFSSAFDNATNLTISVKPEYKKVVLSIKQSKYSTALKFDFNLCASPFNSNKKGKILFKNDMFLLLLDFLNNEHKFKFNFEYKVKYMLDELLNVLKLVDISNKNNDKPLYMEIITDGLSIDTLEFKIETLDAKWMLSCYDTTNKLNEIYHKISIKQNSFITLEELEVNTSHVDVIYQLLHNDIVDFVSEFTPNKDMSQIKISIDKAVYILPISFLIDGYVIGAFIILISDVEKIDDENFKIIPFERKIYNKFTIKYEDFNKEFYNEIYTSISNEFKDDNINITLYTKEYTYDFDAKVVEEEK